MIRFRAEGKRPKGAGQKLNEKPRAGVLCDLMGAARNAFPRPRHSPASAEFQRRVRLHPAVALQSPIAVGDFWRAAVARVLGFSPNSGPAGSFGRTASLAPGGTLRQPRSPASRRLV